MVTLSLGDYIDTAAIGVVLALNATIGFIQERRAEASVQALMSLVSPSADVLRDGQEVEIGAHEVVPGDVVLLGSGERVPADLRLLSSTDLQIDESLLTGESVPITKGTEAVEQELPLAERTCMAFNGSALASGRAQGVVVATGERTELGRIAEQVRETEGMRSPLQERMDRFAHIIGVVIAVAVALTVGLGLALGETLTEMLSVAAALAVAAIPEALPVALTVALALGVRRMADRNAIVRRLSAVETLGSTTLIGSDKTGTLTQNRMSVEQLWTLDDRIVFEDEELPGDPRDAQRRDVPGPDTDVPTLALLAGTLANEGGYEVTDDEVTTDGDPTETAFLLAAGRHGYDPNECRDAWREVADIPFESERRYAASFHERDGAHHVFVKGAPEQLLTMCDHVARVGEDGEVEVRDLDADAVQSLADEIATHGLRVLATAHRELDGPPSDTDVAREASELVLADDNFVSIASAVEEGRVTFDNVRKVTFFLISTGVGTFIVIPISMLLGWPLIMVPAQVLWANLITKGLQDLSLAFEPGEPDVLDRPPLGRDEPVINRWLWVRTVISGAWIGAGVLLMYAWAQGQDYSLAQERTIALTTLVLFQAFHLFSSRSELRSVFTMNPLENRFLALAQTGALAVHVGALYWAGTQFVLRFEPVPGDAWWRMLAVSVTVLAVVELDKLVRRQLQR